MWVTIALSVALAINLVATAALLRRVFSPDYRKWRLERRRRKWAAQVRKNPPRSAWTARELPRRHEAVKVREDVRYVEDLTSGGGDTLMAMRFDRPDPGQTFTSWGDFKVPVGHYLVEVQNPSRPWLRDTKMFSPEEFAARFRSVEDGLIVAGNFKSKPRAPAERLTGGRRGGSSVLDAEEDAFIKEVAASLTPPGGE